MDTRGSLHKRLGFGKLDALSQVFNLFTNLPTIKGKTPEDPEPEELNDNLVYAKLLKNDNKVFRNLSAFSGERAYREYQKLYGGQNNSFKLLLITTNLYENKSTAWLYEAEFPELDVDGSGEYEDHDTISITEQKVDLPVLFKWDKNLLNIDSIDFFDKIYFTTNNKGLVVFDREDDTFKYYGKDLVDENDVPIVNAAYKPTAMEIRKIGFNMLGDSPLTWIDYQSITTHSIQGIFLTTIEGTPVVDLPSGGKFKVYVLYTGADATFNFTFKEGEKDLTASVTKDTTNSVAGYNIYEVELGVVPTSEVEIKIEKSGAGIDPYYDYYSVGSPDPEAKAVETLNIGEYGICEAYNRAVYYKGDTIWFSEINNFDYVPNYNYATLPIEPIDEITKIVFFRNVYIVFTKYRVYKFMGQFGTTEFQIMPVNMAIGCHAPNTVVPIENELYFASTRGLFSLRSSEFRDGIENLRELDTKVKSLTSDTSLYIKELTEPAIRHNGISERAYAFRYKDKYMLFFNTAYEAGELTAPFQSDALSYNYDLKAFVAIKFPIKPTFMFIVDNAIETFATVKEKEEYTEETPLLEYDFESGTSNTITDLTGNNYDGTLHNGYLQPGYGIGIGADSYLKLPTIPSSVDVESGFEIEIDTKLTDLTAGRTLFDLGQLEATSSAGPSSGNVYTDWSNGYRMQMIYATTPNPLTQKSTVSYTLRLLRDATSRYATPNGVYEIKEGSNVLVAQASYSVNFGSSLYVDIKTGTFVVDHDESGNYKKNWNLRFTGTYPTYSTGYDIGSDKSFDTTKYPSWANWLGLRFIGTAKGYTWGARVTMEMRVVLKSRLNVGARNAYAWINGEQKNLSAPAINASSGEFSCGTVTQDIYYSGGRNTSVDGRYNVRATLSGTYRENVDVDAFDIVLPTITPYTITTWNPFTTNKTSSVEFAQISTPSKREIYIQVTGTGALKIGANSEFATGEIITSNNIVNTSRHKWLFKFVKEAERYNVSIYRNGTQMTAGILALNTVKNTNRDNAMIGKSNSTGLAMLGEVYGFVWRVANGDKVVDYTFNEGRGNKVKDNSGNNRVATITGTENWLVETGLRLDGINSYVTIPELGSDIMWSNGFAIEFEAKLDGIEQVAKIVDLAIGYNTGSSYNQKSSINIGTSANKDNLAFMSSSIDLKTIRTSADNIDVIGKHKWKCEVLDNGKGYTMSIYKDDVEITSTEFNYGGITNLARKSNYIGRSNSTSDVYLKGMLYNFKISINESVNPVPIFVGALYEYDTTYDDFGRPMEVALETKGVNLHYPLHIKKLKNMFIKGLGGFTYQDFLCYIKSDGHLVNNPYIYKTYIDPNTREVVYEYEENRELDFNEKLSLLGNLRLDNTRLGEDFYETRKLVARAKGKNFSLRFEGESSDSLSIESIGFIVKLGKVKER